MMWANKSTFKPTGGLHELKDGTRKLIQSDVSLTIDKRDNFNHFMKLSNNSTEICSLKIDKEIMLG